MESHQDILFRNEKEVTLLLKELIRTIQLFSESSNGIIFTAGNGGSATTADHFAADLSLMNLRTGHKFRSICLNSHMGLNTALANDVSYDDALHLQFQNYDNKENLLIVFSASGNSPNIVNLLKNAINYGLNCWAFLGFDGGKSKTIDGINSIIFPDINRNYGIVENIHLMATHFIIDELTRYYRKPL